MGKRRVISDQQYLIGERNGIDRIRVYKRWAGGMPIEEAITKPVREKAESGSILIPEWVYVAAEKLGVSRKRTYLRIYTGWSEERAATEPLRWRKKMFNHGFLCPNCGPVQESKKKSVRKVQLTVCKVCEAVVSEWVRPLKERAGHCSTCGKKSFELKIWKHQLLRRCRNCDEVFNIDTEKIVREGKQC